MSIDATGAEFSLPLCQRFRIYIYIHRKAPTSPRRKGFVEAHAVQENALLFQCLEAPIHSIFTSIQQQRVRQREDQGTFTATVQPVHHKRAWNGLVQMDVVCTRKSFHDLLWSRWNEGLENLIHRD